MNLFQDIQARIKKLERLRDAILEVDGRDLRPASLELIPAASRRKLAELAAAKQQGSPPRAAAKPKTKAKKDRLSEEGRKKIIEAQKRRHEAARQVSQSRPETQPAAERHEGAA